MDKFETVNLIKNNAKDKTVTGGSFKQVNNLTKSNTNVPKCNQFKIQMGLILESKVN